MYVVLAMLDGLSVRFINVLELKMVQSISVFLVLVTTCDEIFAIISFLALSLLLVI